MVKIIRVSKIQLSNGFGTNLSHKSFLNNQSALKISQRDSINDKYSISTDVQHHAVNIQPLSHPPNNSKVPEQRQNTSTTGQKTTKWDFSTNSIIDTHAEKSRNHRRKRGAYPWFRLCCCCLSCAALFFIGVIAAVVALLVTKHSQTTMPIVTTVLVSSSTIVTTSTSITTILPTITVVTTTSTIATTTVTTTSSVTAATTVTTVSTSSATVTTTSITVSSSSTTTNTPTTPTATSTTTTGISISNWLINGDGETGPCESSNGVTHPTGWNYNGNITQVYYNNTSADQKFTDPGPGNRGKCYFYGQISTVTSMWQTVNMTGSINPVLIDNQTVYFNFSAWIGGYDTQDDNARVTLTFLDQSNHGIGGNFTLGPVLAAARGSTTSLVFRQSNGLVPVGARSFVVTVTITLVTGTYNDGDVDNIALHLHQ